MRCMCMMWREQKDESDWSSLAGAGVAKGMVRGLGVGSVGKGGGDRLLWVRGRASLPRDLRGVCWGVHRNNTKTDNQKPDWGPQTQQQLQANKRTIRQTNRKLWKLLSVAGIQPSLESYTNTSRRQGKEGKTEREYHSSQT